MRETDVIQFNASHALLWLDSYSLIPVMDQMSNCGLST